MALTKRTESSASPRLTTSADGRDAPADRQQLSGLDGAVLLVSDVRVANLFAQEARNRTIDRLFGLPKDQAALASLIALLALAQAVHDKGQQALRAPGGPSLADGLIGGSVVREVVYGVAGPSARETPLFGTLLTIAILGGAARPGLVKTLHAARARSQKMNLTFRHRYGYVIDPGHWRERRAQRRRAQAADSAKEAGSPAK
jgi:hypothetical protein